MAQAKKAKTRRKVVTEFIEGEEEEQMERIDPSEIIDPDDDSIRSIVGQFGGQDMSVKVYRVTAHGKSYCFTEGPEITEETIRNHPYGGHGRFTCHVMIAGELRRVFQANVEPPQTSAAGTSHGGSDPTLLRILERLEARLSQGSNEPMSAVLNAAVGLINSQAQKPIETPLDQLMKMAEFMTQLRGGGDSDGGGLAGVLSGIAREVAPTLLPMLLQKNPGPAGGSVSQQSEQAIIAQGLQYLKRKSMMGADPALYLDLILDNIDDERYQSILRFVLKNEFSAFVAIDPAIGEPPCLAFFQFLYNGLRSALSSANPMDVDTGGPGGNTPNTNGNGQPRKVGGKSG